MGGSAYVLRTNALARLDGAVQDVAVMETRAMSDAAHVASVLAAAERGRRDPDADLTLMLGDLESAGVRSEASGSEVASDRQAVLDRVLTQLARDAYSD
jgi:hypothetical protein